jgi:hypothetical protein
LARGVGGPCEAYRGESTRRGRGERERGEGETLSP